jgi:hypothetical protein
MDRYEGEPPGELRFDAKPWRYEGRQSLGGVGPAARLSGSFALPSLARDAKASAPRALKPSQSKILFLMNR